MHLIGLSAACMAVLVSSARAALIDASLSLPNLIGTSQGSGNPIVKVPTVTNPNGQLTGQVISVSGGNPSAVKAQVLNPSTPNPGTTTVTGGNFNVLGTSVGASATVQTPGGTFNQITAQAVGMSDAFGNQLSVIPPKVLEVFHLVAAFEGDHANTFNQEGSITVVDSCR